jgi:uncharacterized protein
MFRAWHIVSVVSFVLLAFSVLPAAARNPIDDINCDTLPQIRADAEHNDPKAQLDLGKLYLNGHCVATDANEAAKWTVKAAKQEYTPAQATLAALYYQGHFYEDAAKMAEKAADKGDSASQFLLATLCQRGLGVAQDYTEAARWAMRSAKQGNFGGQFLIGRLYKEGNGVPKDNIEADKWYDLSIKKAEDKRTFTHVKAELEAQMSERDIAEAQRRADAWKPTPESPPQ